MFTPVSEALKQLESWLERDGASRIIVAEPTLKKLKHQRLPEHMRITRKKRRGARQALRGRRHYREPQLKLAVWPEDGLDENALPSAACVLSGEVDFNVADYMIHCRAGDCIVFPPGVPKQDGHKPHFEGDPNGRFGEVLWIYTGSTRSEGLSCWICRSDGRLHTKPPDSSCRVEQRFLAELFNGFCSEMLTVRRAEIAQRLLSLVLLMLRSEIEMGNALKEWGKPRYQGKDKQSGPIAEALAYIEENLDAHLTIDKVARQVIVSPATFTRRFKEETGKTFQEYQTGRRMEIAEELLTAAEHPVSYICRRVGLKYGQLWSLFQKKHACSPSEFRQRENDRIIKNSSG